MGPLLSASTPVLVIEPDEDRARLLQEIMGDGWDVEFARSLRGAEKSARARPPALLILDCSAGKGGKGACATDLIESVRRSDEHARVISITPGGPQDGLFDRVLAPPFDHITVARAIQDELWKYVLIHGGARGAAVDERPRKSEQAS